MHPMAYRLHTFTPPSPCPQVSTPNPSAPASRTPRGSWSVVPSRSVRASATCRTLAPPSTTSWVPDEKLHAVVARSTFWSQNVQNTSKHTILGPLLEVETSKKSAHRCGAKKKFKSKIAMHNILGPLLEVETSKKVHAVVARSTSKAKCEKHHMLGQLWTFSCRFAGQAQGIVHLVTASKKWGFSSISKNDGRRGTCEEDLERSILRGRGNTRDMLIRDVRRSGRWYPERDCVLEHQIFSFGKMMLCDRCSTPYDPGLVFAAGAIL